MNRGQLSMVLGAAIVIVSTLVYSVELNAPAVITPSEVSFLGGVAVGYLVAVAIGIALIGLGGYLAIASRISWIQASGVAPLSPSWIFTFLVRTRRYRLAFIFAVLAYGAFYSFITSMVVYQPGVDFAAAYAAQIPSIVVIPIAASPLYTPVLTAYLTDHIAVLVIPLTLFLALATSVLVGLNFTLSVFALDNRAKAVGRSWIGGVGAVVGLFTGCPTCAGLFFANFIGGTGAVSFATILGYYQPIFLLISLPVLVLTPYLVSRNLAKIFKDGCLLVNPTRQKESGGAERQSELPQPASIGHSHPV